MPALVNSDYDSDGVEIWSCSDCDFGVAMRGSAKTWVRCPMCGVVYTHNEEADSREARDRRYDRRDSRFYAPVREVRKYRVKAWVPNTRRWGDNSFASLRHWDDDDDPLWMRLDDSPEPFLLEVWEDLTFERAYDLIQMLHGCPKWVTLQERT